MTVASGDDYDPVSRRAIISASDQSRENPRIPGQVHPRAPWCPRAPRGGRVHARPRPPRSRKRLGGGTVVVKAQIHAGGRGKGGGVKLAKGADEAERIARDLIGMTLKTHQTGPEGRVVSRVLVEEGLAITRELYLGLVLDRGVGRPVVMASAAGGVDIEEVAAKTPDAICKEYVAPGVGLVPFQARKLAFALGLDGAQANKATKVMVALYDAFVATDASLVEINPLVVTAAATCWPSTRR